MKLQPPIPATPVGLRSFVLEGVLSVIGSAVQELASWGEFVTIGDPIFESFSDTVQRTGGQAGGWTSVIAFNHGDRGSRDQRNP